MYRTKNSLESSEPRIINIWSKLVLIIFLFLSFAEKRGNDESSNTKQLEYQSMIQTSDLQKMKRSG